MDHILALALWRVLYKSSYKVIFHVGDCVSQRQTLASQFKVDLLLSLIYTHDHTQTLTALTELGVMQSC